MEKLNFQAVIKSALCRQPARRAGQPRGGRGSVYTQPAQSGCTVRPCSQAVQSGCTVRLYSQAVQSGRTVRLYSQAVQSAQSGCSVRLHAVQSGCPVRLSSQTVQSGWSVKLYSHAVQSHCPVRLYSQAVRFLEKMIDWGRPGETWAGDPKFLENGKEQKPL